MVCWSVERLMSETRARIVSHSSYRRRHGRVPAVGEAGGGIAAPWILTARCGRGLWVCRTLTPGEQRRQRLPPRLALTLAADGRPEYGWLYTPNHVYWGGLREAAAAGSLQPVPPDSLRRRFEDAHLQVLRFVSVSKNEVVDPQILAITDAAAVTVGGT
jgi:hypothetical protein